MNHKDLHFSETHEWVRIEDAGGERIATLGISAFAVEQLSDVVGLELPEKGRRLAAGEEFGVAESVKAVSPLYTPVAGEVAEVNTKLEDNFDVFKEDPYGQGWIVKIRLDDDASVEGLMDHAAYQKQCAEEG